MSTKFFGHPNDMTAYRPRGGGASTTAGPGDIVVDAGADWTTGSCTADGDQGNDGADTGQSYFVTKVLTR